MHVEGKMIVGGDPYRKAVQDRAARREQAEARWNSASVQGIEAERRAMQAEKDHTAKIHGINLEMARVRGDLDKMDKARIAKEAELRRLVEQLAELTSQAVPAPEIEAGAAPATGAPRGRGRPPKATS